MLLLDSWEGVALGTSTAAAKVSGIITVPAGAGPVTVTVSFAGASLTLAQLHLSWANATASGAVTSQFLPMGKWISTSQVWMPDSNSTGKCRKTAKSVAI